MKTRTTQLWIKRSRARGVAMVEAGILAPIFAMMMMMTTYLGGVYEAKYKSVLKERYNTWSYASSGCENSPPNASEDGAATQQQDTGSSPCEQPSGGGQASSSMFTAHAYDEEQWTYQPTLRFNGGSAKTVRTDGYTVCNEKKAAAGITSIFTQLGSELGQLFGQVSGGGSPCN